VQLVQIVIWVEYVVLQLWQSHISLELLLLLSFVLLFFGGVLVLFVLLFVRCIFVFVCGIFVGTVRLRGLCLFCFVVVFLCVDSFPFFLFLCLFCYYVCRVFWFGCFVFVLGFRFVGLF